MRRACFVYPSVPWQVLFTEMVGQGEDLANAIALNSSIFNGARLVGPALAGFLLTWTSAGVCFLANGISYAAVIVALLAMPLPQRRYSPTPGPVLAGINEGTSNTVLQTIVDEDKRGRIMSLFTMVVTGLAPIGGLLAGSLAD